MKCHEAKRQLDLFMDGELAVPENMKVLEHLNLCRPCAGAFEGEKRLRAGLKASLGALRAPAGLMERLAEPPALRPELPGTSRRWGKVAAAALFFTIVGSLLFTPSPEFQLMAAEFSERHAAQRYACPENDDSRRCLCGDCTGDVAGSIRSFFEKHAERDYCAHLAESARLGWTPAGVAAWRCRGEDVFWSTWKTADGGTVSHALAGCELGGKPRFARRGGRPVLFYPRRDALPSDLACIFVFETEAEAARFAKALGVRAQ